jgi:phosphonate metabolism protein PhnN/1,5-bisphosphokinase (PRPP-forming)
MNRAPLILVVGPSGSGKDALIDGARQRLAAGGRFHFARRVVTRPAAAGGEDHDSVSLAEFRRREAAGDFLLWWEAHGLAYGIPRTVEDIRQEGVAVVANVSRSVVESARRALAPVGVVVVTAPPAVLAARLDKRGRESAEDIGRRLERAADPLPSGDGVCTVINDRGLDEGVARFVAALEMFHAPAKM